MVKFEKMNDLSRKIKEIAESAPLHDVNKNTNALFKSILTKMELVSREEFDIQSEVLKKSQIKIIELEQKISELEKQLKSLESTKN